VQKLPPPSKAQEKLISKYYGANIWFDEKVGELFIEYKKHRYVGFGCDWYLLGKKNELIKVSEDEAGEFNDFLSIFTRKALRKKEDPLF
jgi:hypothetical protein